MRNHRFFCGVGPSGYHFAIDSFAQGDARYAHGPYANPTDAKIEAARLNDKIEAANGVKRYLDQNRTLNFIERYRGGYAITTTTHSVIWVFGSYGSALKKWEQLNA